MPVEILGEIKSPLDTIVRDAVHRSLDTRPAKFVVHISEPHGEVIVHIREPFDRRLKFSSVSELEIGRELYTALTEIVEEGGAEPSPSPPSSRPPGEVGPRSGG